MSRLQGRVCVVNGAASVIGQAVARRFRDEGATVVAVDMHPCGVGDFTVQADLVDETQVAGMYDQVVRHLQQHRQLPPLRWGMPQRRPQSCS
jgi:NAD(P)-dependent dehydrogenase (short-subunit alcohol dehydrogenase family)